MFIQQQQNGRTSYSLESPQSGGCYSRLPLFAFSTLSCAGFRLLDKGQSQVAQLACYTAYVMHHAAASIDCIDYVTYAAS